MLPFIQLIIAILLIVCILLQQRGSGLGAAFGGEGSVYRTKRGAEKAIFTFTIILAILFLSLALLNVYLSSQDITEPDLTEEPQELPEDLPTDEEEETDQILFEGEEPKTDEPEKEPEDTKSIFDIGE